MEKGISPHTVLLKVQFQNYLEQNLLQNGNSCLLQMTTKSVPGRDLQICIFVKDQMILMYLKARESME